MTHTPWPARIVAIAAVCVGIGFLARPAALGAQRAVGGGDGSRQPPVLTTFGINGGAESVSATAPAVTLTHTVVGARPSDYRVSRRADFAGAQWLSYAPAPLVRDWYDGRGATCETMRGSHLVTLFFQVRALVGEEVRIVDGLRQLRPAHVESNVLRASICARAARPS